MHPITPESANRLAIGLAKSRRITYDAAEAILRSISLRIVLPATFANRAASQAAFLTAINTAQRAFLGGVQLEFPTMAPLRLNLSGGATLGDAVALTGYEEKSIQRPTHSIFIGAPDASAQDDDVCAHADGWRAGVSDVGAMADFLCGDGDDLALGGIMAGALAVHRCFVRATSLPALSLDAPLGLSLWNPKEDWRIPIEQKLKALPTRFWLLGLGHLGQAFIWSLALLPFPEPRDVEFLLQDFDSIDESNKGSGLLCDARSIGRMKTRHCAEWLEKLNFKTKLTERKFGAEVRCEEDEPRIAFCGFDRAAPRRFLEKANFDLVIECGLGGSLADFDQIDINVFPSTRHTAEKLWGATVDTSRPVDESLVRLFGGEDQACGALQIDVAGKSVSTSFVGAMASALVVAELLRTFNKGPRFDAVTFDARNPQQSDFMPAATAFRPSQLARMGFATV
ncbi:MAG: hypothetical protein WC661_02090 [Opitutaceae bacterium]|jgi:hypothetical protein